MQDQNLVSASVNMQSNPQAQGLIMINLPDVVNGFNKAD